MCSLLSPCIGPCFVLKVLDVIVAAFGPKAGFADAIVFAVLGLVLRRKSRTAAVIAVALMFLNIIVSISRVPLVGPVTIILFVCLLSSVRGTFAFAAQQSDARTKPAQAMELPR